MKLLIASAAAALMLCVAFPAAAQSTRERAVKRCQDNRGTDCSSEQGLRPWMDEEKPMTEAQRRSAAAANLRRQNEAKAAADRRNQVQVQQNKTATTKKQPEAARK